MSSIQEKIEDVEKQKLVGYIVYDIWTFKSKGPEDPNWQHHVITPKVHWRKKIYTQLSHAEEAAKHLEGHNRLAKAIVVPIYANKKDLDNVKKGHKELTERVEQINKNINE